MNTKETQQTMGVFQIRNLTNEKVFVGSSLNLDGIFNRHKFALNAGTTRIRLCGQIGTSLARKISLLKFWKNSNRVKILTLKESWSFWRICGSKIKNLSTKKATTHAK